MTTEGVPMAMIPKVPGAEHTGMNLNMISDGVFRVSS